MSIVGYTKAKLDELLGGKLDQSQVDARVTAVGNGIYAPQGPARVRNLGQTQNRYVDPAAVTQRTAAANLPLVTVPTGYANNDITEPSVLYDAAAPFLGYEYALCAAPYPGSDDTYENPCLWVSHDGTIWVPVVNGTPTPGYGGTATPIVPTRVQGDGKNSDPYLVRGPDGTYYVLWNQFLNATPTGTGTGGNTWSIKAIKASSLAGPWSTPVTLVATVMTTSRPTSPSLLWDGQQWHMYAVETANTSATTLMHYTNPSADPTAGTWTKQTNPAASLPSGYTGQVWWHLNCYLAGSQHVLLIQDNKAGTSGGGNVWIVTSNDSGATWTVPAAPCIASANCYRSALIFTADGGVDVFVGRLGTSWELRRTRLGLNAATTTPSDFGYGGLSVNGLPVHALAMAAARVPVDPYTMGDTVNRADSATSPGTADSGQAYTVASGTVGVSSKQLYAPTAGNNKAVITTTGCADGVSAAKLAAPDPAASMYLLFRYTDGSNFVRFGTTGTHYIIDNIVAGAVGQTANLGNTPTAGDVIAAQHVGGTIKCYLNGQLIATLTGWTANDTASSVGVQLAGTAGRFKNLYQRALVNGA